MGSNVVFKATTCKACNRYATEWCLFAWLMHDATCKLVAFTEVRVAIKSISNFQRHPDPHKLLIFLHTPFDPEIGSRPASCASFCPHLPSRSCRLLTPCRHPDPGGQNHAPTREGLNQKWGKSIRNGKPMANSLEVHGISPTLNNLNNTSGSGPGMPCPVPVQSLSSPCPLPCHPHPRRTTSRRSGCSTSRFGHSSRHFEGVHQRNCCARDRWHSTNNTTENNHNQESQATREIYSFKSSWVLSLMMKLVGLCYGWAVWSM